MGQRLHRIKVLLHSRKGRNAITFLVFLVISSILWIVQSLNEEAQREISLSVKVVNVPDSVVRVTPVPEKMNVIVSSRGTSLLKYLFQHRPEVAIDYRHYARNCRIMMNEMTLKNFLRSKIGGGCQIVSVAPDSISVYFTAHHGEMVPVVVDAHIEPGPQYAIIGQVRPLTDSVMLYSINQSRLPSAAISTAPIVLNNVSSSQTLCVPLVTPPMTRVIPDSVEVRVEVEPLVSKHREIEIQAVNVPPGVNLVLMPRQIEVYYMVPMSVYKSLNGEPRIVVQADYNSLYVNPAADKIAVKLVSAPSDFFDVYLTTDSVSYMIENN